MKPIKPGTLLRLYEQGHFTPREFLSHLVGAATSYPPEELVLLIPAAEMRTIRELAASPPSTFEDTPRMFAIGSWDGPHDSAAEEWHQRQKWHEGIWRWHRFFSNT